MCIFNIRAKLFSVNLVFSSQSTYPILLILLCWGNLRVLCYVQIFYSYNENGQASLFCVWYNVLISGSQEANRNLERGKEQENHFEIYHAFLFKKS